MYYSYSNNNSNLALELNNYLQEVDSTGFTIKGCFADNYFHRVDVVVKMAAEHHINCNFTIIKEDNKAKVTVTNRHIAAAVATSSQNNRTIDCAVLSRNVFASAVTGSSFVRFHHGCCYFTCDGSGCCFLRSLVDITVMSLSLFATDFTFDLCFYLCFSFYQLLIY